MHVLHPTPVSGGFAGEPGTGWETIQFVVVVIVFCEPVLVPHGIGDHPVEGSQLTCLVAEFGVLESVADLDLALHVMNNHIHIGHSPGVGDVFLSIEFQWGVFLFAPQTHLLFHRNLTLNEQTAGTTAGIIDIHAGFGIHDFGHDQADFSGGVEFPSTLTAAFGEFPNEIFITLADDICFDIIKTKMLGTDGFNQIRQSIIINITLPVGRCIEINAVDDPLKCRFSIFS